MKAGDSLGKIAVTHGITIRELKKLNGLTTDTMRQGQILKVPAGKKPELPGKPKPRPVTENEIRGWVNEAKNLAGDAQFNRTVPTVKKCEYKLAEIEKAIKKDTFRIYWQGEVDRIRKDLPRLLVIAPYRVDQAGTRIYLDAKPVDKPEHVWRNPNTGMNEAVFEATDIATRMDILCESQVWSYPDLLQEATVPNGVKRVEWKIIQ